ncbi:anti sigma factor C-terminal domain-containing protein [Streptococcus suis]|uniref:anti sigma factor C-terminal domain-containing protein n=2 Tax=Streptococcus suis TaxID=1307 RepID=UPI0028B0F386|nr:anti sigma factor C-terminal domain-containing protein [Streptococcus suis]WNN04065.1 anti sigma factor C-terminal domain-containing protein [Streptococcus suis]WNN10978.1 anti sigma factor C-terminal domain-containing protein [Streptococcus suis]WNO80087.1 anti sigma factor C-terminal domain-containing protein [Streptococcus suis]HEM4203658.1 anti sigma factor C-terminal domain-containing protein [Streptococcus suis]
MNMKTFEIATKKSKKKHLWKTVGLSILGLLLITGVTLKTLQILTANNGEKIYQEHELLSQVAYPNIEYSTYYYKATSLFAGAVHADRHKDLAGVPVAFGDYEYHYDWLGTYLNFSQDGPSYKGNIAYDRQTWSKLPLFYNTDKVDTDDFARVPSQELSLVKDMSNQLVEVAITFDKKYSFGDLQTMLPQNLKKNWYWIGTASKKNTADFRIDQLFGLDGEVLQVYQPDPNLPKEAEIWNPLTPMKKMAEQYNHYLGEYALVTDVKTFLDKFGKTDFSKQESIDKLEFAGIILTGKAEDFAQLEGKDWIYASSIGASIPIQPYYQLHH